MKVAATSTMTKEINKYLTEHGKKMRAVYLTLMPRDYEIKVDYDLLRNEIDYLPASGKMRVISIVYPPEFYATPRHLTTIDIVKIFKRTDKTFNGLMQGIIDEIAI